MVEEEVPPRPYNVSTPGGTFRWNRRNLTQVPEGPGNGDIQTNQTELDQNGRNPPVHRNTRVSSAGAI